MPGTYHLARPDPWAVLHDAGSQFAPWELEVRHALGERRLPFWSDRLDGGSSPWANPQAAVLSPIAMAARALPIQHHLLGALALKILVGCQGAWLLARGLGARRAAACGAGIAWALSGGIIAWAVFPHSSVAAWGPWLVAAALTLARRPGPAALAATAAIVAAVLYSGHPEVALGMGLLAVVVALRFLRRRRAGRSLGALVLAVVLGAGLAAPMLFPFLSLLPRTQRAQEHAERRQPTERADLLRPRTWFLWDQGMLFVAPTNPLAFGRPYREDFRGAVAWPVAETPYAGAGGVRGTGSGAGRAAAAANRHRHAARVRHRPDVARHRLPAAPARPPRDATAAPARVLAPPPGRDPGAGGGGRSRLE